MAAFETEVAAVETEVAAFECRLTRFNCPLPRFKCAPEGLDCIGTRSGRRVAAVNRDRSAGRGLPLPPQALAPQLEWRLGRLGWLKTRADSLYSYRHREREKSSESFFLALVNHSALANEFKVSPRLSRLWTAANDRALTDVFHRVLGCSSRAARTKLTFRSSGWLIIPSAAATRPTTPTRMHPHAALITRFYTAFQARDAAAMAACYHADVHFSDPVFPDLRGPAAGAMWTMLCARGKDLRLEYHDVHADDQRGSARWDARYTFSGTGRAVLNRIRAEFRFRDGRIIRHVDDFSFWTWSRQALGPAGLLLGWTPWLRAKVQRQAAAGLRA